MLKKVDHIGIATSSIEKALLFWRDICQFQPGPVESIPSQQVRVCMLNAGNCAIELIEPTGPESAIAKFIERKGEGLLHICFEVEEIQDALNQLADKGCRLVDDRPWQSPHGLAAFIHPQSGLGVSIELRQHQPGGVNPKNEQVGVCTGLIQARSKT